jgi:hypothetical protein
VVKVDRALCRAIERKELLAKVRRMTMAERPADPGCDASIRQRALEKRAIDLWLHGGLILRTELGRLKI